MRRTSLVSVLVAVLGLLPLLALPAGAQPGNDAIENATEVIEPLPYQDGPVDTTEATGDPSDPECVSEPGDLDNPTVWYTYTPSESFAGAIRADTFGSNYDTTLSAYVLEGEELIQIACNDDAGSLQSLIVIEVGAGETVLFMVGAFAGEPGGGSLMFNVDVSDIEVPMVELTIDPIGRFNKAGAAIVSGTMACSGASFAEISGHVVQPVGRFVIVGEFFLSGGEGENGENGEAPLEVVCDGTSQPWSAEAHSDTGLFKGGKASVEAFAFVCGDFECTEVVVEQQIGLRGGR